jgi:hypothetical protein
MPVVTLSGSTRIESSKPFPGVPRQRTRDALPKRILTKGRELVKEARGLKR